MEALLDQNIWYEDFQVIADLAGKARVVKARRKSL